MFSGGDGSYKVRDLALAAEGRKKIEWAESRMPVLMQLRRLSAVEKPLRGARIAGCLHVTKETAVLVRTLVAAGAEVAWSGCNPLSTQDDVAAALAAEGIPIYAWHGMSVEEFYWCIDRVLGMNPTLTLDDGADLIFSIHNRHKEKLAGVWGGTEETTTGVHRLRAMGEDGALGYPVIAVNNAETKWEFDNVYGTGQSSLDGILRATSILIAGKNFVVAGFGRCGRGCATRARGLGAQVIVTEIDPIPALKATLDGFRVLPMDEAARVGEIFITATGMKDVLVGRHFEAMRDGAVICNTGHYDCEIRISDLEALARSKREIRRDNEEYTLKDGRRVYLLAQGRLVNLAAAEGHPSEVMDMSFANQFLAMRYLVDKHGTLANKVYDVPKEQDDRIAALKLETLGIRLDVLTAEQVRYRTDYASGT